MSLNKWYGTGLLLLSLVRTGLGQPDSLNEAKRMQWFHDAKLGIFIHWGIYAVKGIDESWSFFNEYLSHEDYLKQTEGFTASKYDPAEWAHLIKTSGAKYTVITTRHHDGFSLWNSRGSELNAVNSAARRDVLTPYIQAAKQQGLRIGLYYSLPDWSFTDYPNETKNIKRYDANADTQRWQRFLSYYQGQLDELESAYHPDLWWFDGDWEFSAEKWEAAKVRKRLLSANKDVIINSRLAGHGDYATPEQGLPVNKPVDPYWELCMTMNDSWGYQPNDTNYKTSRQIIQIFANVIGHGGNLLLDIGPKADGTIPAEQSQVLLDMGRWTQKHQEAIYGSQAGLPPGYFYGPSTLSADGQTLYLFLPYHPQGQIELRGVKNQINRIRVVGDGTKLDHQVMMKPYWSTHAGLIYIDVPDYVLDPDMTVIAVQLKGKLELE